MALQFAFVWHAQVGDNSTSRIGLEGPNMNNVNKVVLNALLWDDVVDTTPSGVNRLGDVYVIRIMIINAKMEKDLVK